MADAKTREKDSELILAQAEFDRKLKQVEERILYRRQKTEDRQVLDLKHDHAVTLEEVKRTNEEKSEEIDYLNEKILKIQEENKQLILKKDNKSDVVTAPSPSRSAGQSLFPPSSNSQELSSSLANGL